jgi:uncharacterized protein YqjF (DUF2071 family)
MKIPSLIGSIDRRILLNFRVDKQMLTSLVPAPFQLQLVDDQAIVGICLIRLKHLRPKGLPKAIGFSSENGAHRIAVEWQEKGLLKQGVYIPRRDTSSKINAMVGGQFFGTHYLADFQVRESEDAYSIAFQSEDRTYLSMKARLTTDWNSDSVFANLEAASQFFQQGSVGYSPQKEGSSFEGVELKTKHWQVLPLRVQQVESSFFDNKKIFPKGSIQFDNALLMKNIEHEWNSVPTIKRRVEVFS